MWAWQFAKALYLADQHGWTRFISMQNHYNLLYREEEREMIPLCTAEGVGVIPWSPLARGFLAGNRRVAGEGSTSRARSDSLAQNFYYQELDFEILAQVERLAEKHGVTSAQIALAWMLHKDTITSPIIGASKLEHLDQAAHAMDIALEVEEIKLLEKPYQPRHILGHK